MKIECYPVCDCGYVFTKLNSYIDLVEVGPNHLKEVRYFNPSACPKCNKEITDIELPRKGYGGYISFNKK